MATLKEFVKMTKLSHNDKTSGKRMREIIDVLRQYHVTQGLTPQKAVDVLEALGPTFVKIGQIAATRSDMLPQDYCEAFFKLQTDVKPMPFDAVIECIDKAYGKNWNEVFLAIDPKPLGSASIAQVHKAVLLDGSVVAVKVRRPGIVEEMKDDIRLMKRLLATAEFVTSQHENILLNFENLLDELQKTTEKELDFRIELQNLVRFHANMAKQDGISSPIPYPEISNASVFVMQYIEGVQVDDKEALVKAGVDLNKLASQILHSYIVQILDDGFFHADPHGGNIIIKDKTIIWIDLGMTGSLKASQRELVSQMFRALVADDPYKMMQAVLGISHLNGDVNYGMLLSQLGALIHRYGGADLSDINMAQVAEELMDIMHSQHLIMDPSVTMLVRGIVTIEGMIERMSPSTNVMKIVSESVLRESFTPRHIEMKAVELSSATLNSIEAMTKIPSQMLNTMEMLDRGEITLKGEVKASEDILVTLYASVGRISLAIISVGLFLGSSILCTTNMEPKLLEVPVLGVLGYLGAFVLGIYVIVQTFRSRHKIRNKEKLN